MITDYQRHRRIFRHFLTQLVSRTPLKAITTIIPKRLFQIFTIFFIVCPKSKLQTKIKRKRIFPRPIFWRFAPRCFLIAVGTVAIAVGSASPGRIQSQNASPDANQNLRLRLPVLLSGIQHSERQTRDHPATQP